MPNHIVRLCNNHHRHNESLMLAVGCGCGAFCKSTSSRGEIKCNKIPLVKASTHCVFSTSVGCNQSYCVSTDVLTAVNSAVRASDFSALVVSVEVERLQGTTAASGP